MKTAAMGAQPTPGLAPALALGMERELRKHWPALFPAILSVAVAGCGTQPPAVTKKVSAQKPPVPKTTPVRPCHTIGNPLAPTPTKPPTETHLPITNRLPVPTIAYATPTGGIIPGGPKTAWTLAVGTAGAKCSSGLGADGSVWTEITTNGLPQPNINYVYSPGGAGPNAGTACAYFPATRIGNIYCDSPPPHEEMEIPINTGNAKYDAALLVAPPGVVDQNIPGSDWPYRYLTVGIVLASSDGSMSQYASCALPRNEKGVCTAVLDMFVSQSIAAFAKHPFASTLHAAIGRYMNSPQLRKEYGIKPHYTYPTSILDSPPPGLIAALKKVNAAGPNVITTVYYNPVDFNWLIFEVDLNHDRGAGIAHKTGGTWKVVTGPGSEYIQCGKIPEKVLFGFGLAHTKSLCPGPG